MNLATPPHPAAPWQAAVDDHLEALAIISHLCNFAKRDDEVSRIVADHGFDVDDALLPVATPFAWSKEPMQACLAASRSIPADVTFSEWNLPTSAAWWWFEEPLPFPTLELHGMSRVGARAICFGWLEKPFTAFDPFLKKNVTRSGRIVGCTVWCDDITNSGYGKITPSQTWAWDEHGTLDAVLRRLREQYVHTYEGNGPYANTPHVGVEKFMTAAEGVSRFVLAGISWLGQRVLVEKTEHVERHRRKEYERKTGQRLDGVRVVSLRRVERPAREQDPEHRTCACEHEYREHERAGNGAMACGHFGCGCQDFNEKKIEWSCRWEVDGHFRNQACGPKHGERRLTWVHPYVKGPEDKELRLPKRKIYVVNR